MIYLVTLDHLQYNKNWSDDIKVYGEQFMNLSLCSVHLFLLIVRTESTQEHVYN